MRERENSGVVITSGPGLELVLRAAPSCGSVAVLGRKKTRKSV